MGKFDLQPSKTSRTPVVQEGHVEVLSETDFRREPQPSLPLSPENVNTILGLATKVVDTKNKIAIIQAERDKQIAQVEAEIKKIVSVTDSQIKALKATGEERRKNFAEKRKIVEECLETLNSHPEYSDEIKKHIVALATKALES